MPKQFFKSNYRNISLLFQNACLTSGGKYAYMAYYDSNSEFKDLIFIDDSRLDESDPDDNFYHFPGSHMSQAIPNLDNGCGSLEIDNKTTRYIAINEESESPNIKAYLFIEYDFEYQKRWTQTHYFF